MPLKKDIKKLDAYFDRVKDQKASRIKPSHVKKIISKLEARRSDLKEKIADTSRPDKRERLAHKLDMVNDQVRRAKALLTAIENPTEESGPS